MLQRQKLWVPIAQHNPKFAEGMERFLHNNPMSTLIASTLGLHPERMYVALEPDARQPERRVPRLLAVPFTVSPAACGTRMSEGARRPFSYGFATNTSDSLNSLHVMERLLPALPIHVSVCLQMSQQQQLYEGDRVVIVSSINKIGKRMAYCSTDFFLDTPEAPSKELEAEEQRVQTVDDLRQVLGGYTRVLSGNHVKSILEKMKKEPKVAEAKT